MKRLWRGFDAGFLVVLLICLLATWPLLSRPSLPEGTDAELHIFRLHELSLLIRGGEVYPRWAPDFYHGYGYPIFNYYAPLTYYLALPLELLPGVDAVGASKAVLIAGLAMGGLGLYGFVRDTWGRRAGFVAAALYVYSPYLQYIDPHIRGALPEAFSFGVFPLALWSLDRVRRRPSPGFWLTAVVMVAGVMLSHNLMGLFFFGLLFAWALWQAVWGVEGHDIDKPGPSPSSRLTPVRTRFVSTAGRPLLALLLGFGMAAFFWLPVILERNAVTLSTLIGAGDNYDFRTHFLSLRELLAFSRRPDWGATQSPFVFNLGVAQWTAGLLGIALLALGRVRARRQLVFFLAALAVVLFLMLPISEPVWELVPFLPYFQFPWRLLGAAGALLAVLGAAGVEGLARKAAANSRDRWIASLGVALPMLLALPLSQPAPWLPFGEVSTARMSEIEDSGRWLGTTSTADYVPAAVLSLPPRRRQMVDPLAAGLLPDRVNRDTLPDGAVVTAEAIRPLLTRYHVSAPKQFRLRLYQFDFPGWRVRLDGEPAVTEVAEPEGLIVVLVPPGEHVVELEFDGTPARTAAWLVTLASALAAMGLAARYPHPARAGAGERASDYPTPVDQGGSREIWPTIIVAGAVTLGAILLQPFGLFHAQSSGRLLDLPASKVMANFADEIVLLGYNPRTERAEAGDAFAVMLYWLAQRPLEEDYQVFVHVRDASGAIVAQSDKLHPGDFPTHRWPLDRYVPDPHRLVLPDNLPPGDYQVIAGLWLRDEGRRLEVLDERGESTGDGQVLFIVRVD